MHTYSSPQDFLEQRDADTAGCIVMDLSMPGLSGLELQQALAQRGRPPAGGVHQRPGQRAEASVAGDEGRRGRLPHQAVRRSRS